MHGVGAFLVNLTGSFLGLRPVTGSFLGLRPAVRPYMRYDPYCGTTLIAVGTRLIVGAFRGGTFRWVHA